MQEILIKEELGSNTNKHDSNAAYDISSLFIKLLPFLSLSSLNILEDGLKDGSVNNAAKLIIADILEEKEKRKQVKLSSV